MSLENTGAQDGATYSCKRCNAALQPGKAMAQTWRAGLPDFPGDAYAVTLSPGGPGRLIDCLKCPACGWSVTQ